MCMRRTVIFLDPEIRDWLAGQARREPVSQAQVVRQALRLYRERVDVRVPHSFAKLAWLTSGLRRGEDGVTAQQRLRNEWLKLTDEVRCGEEK